MENDQDTAKQAKYLKAKERVEELKKFYGNLSSYVVTCLVLAAVNYYSNGFSYMWVLWVVFGWGIGVLFHAMNTFSFNPLCGKHWEKRKIREFMEQEEEIDNWK